MNIFRSLTTLAVLLAATASSQAQYIVLSPQPVFAQPVFAPPVFAAPQPIVNFSFYSPPAQVFPAPVTSFSSPVFVQPTVAFSAPVVAAPVVGGTFVTHTYTGFGIFRPRGTFTETYFRPWGR